MFDMFMDVHYILGLSWLYQKAQYLSGRQTMKQIWIQPTLLTSSVKGSFTQRNCCEGARATQNPTVQPYASPFLSETHIEEQSAANSLRSKGKVLQIKVD